MSEQAAAPATPASAPAESSTPDYFGDRPATPKGNAPPPAEPKGGGSGMLLGTAALLNSDPGETEGEGGAGATEGEAPVEGAEKKYQFKSAHGSTKEMTIAEAQKAFEASVMLQSDYSKKMHEVATTRKQAEAAKTQLAAERTQLQQQQQKIRQFFEEVMNDKADPYYRARLLRSQGIDIQPIVERLVEDVLRERSLPENERIARNIERQRRSAEEEERFHQARIRKAREEAQQEEARIRNERNKRVADGWIKKALTDSGLPDSEYERGRIRTRLAEIARTERRPIGFEDVVEAAGYVKNTLVEAHRKLPQQDLIAGMTPEQKRALAVQLQQHLSQQQPAAGDATRAPAATGHAPRPPAPPAPKQSKRPDLAERIKRGFV